MLYMIEKEDLNALFEEWQRISVRFETMTFSEFLKVFNIEEITNKYPV